MADSEAVRSRRKRLHRAGDHSMCRQCAAKRDGEQPVGPLVLSVAPSVPDAPPRDRLERLASRLESAHEREPENAIVARELRLTLESLERMSPASADPMDELRAMVSGIS